MLSPSARQHVVVEHIDDDAGQPPVFCREDPLAAMNRGMAIRERVNRSMHLNAGAQPIGDARVLEPLDAPLDVVAEQVSQPQLVIVTSQKEVDQIVHEPIQIAGARQPAYTHADRTVPARRAGPQSRKNRDFSHAVASCSHRSAERGTMTKKKVVRKTKRKAAKPTKKAATRSKPARSVRRASSSPLLAPVKGADAPRHRARPARSRPRRRSARQADDLPARFRWSVDMKPIVGTDLCMHAHVGFLAHGEIHIDTPTAASSSTRRRRSSRSIRATTAGWSARSRWS